MKNCIFLATIIVKLTDHEGLVYSSILLLTHAIIYIKKNYSEMLVADTGYIFRVYIHTS